MEDETFEELALDTLNDYIGQVLIHPQGFQYKLAWVTPVSAYEVEYGIEDMPITWRSDINLLLREIGNDYGRAIARGYNN